MDLSSVKISGKNKITKSPFFELIVEAYNEFGHTMNGKEFWESKVKSIDPNIPYYSWMRFVNAFKGQIDNKKKAIIADMTIRELARTRKEMDLEKSSLKNILAISDATIDELVKNPDLLAAIPIKDRMDWLFKAMKARDSRMMTMTKVQAEKRKTSLYEDMMQNAQYGAIEESDIENDPNIDSSPSPLPEPATEPGITLPVDKAEAKEEKVIAFNPNDL